MSGLSKIFRVCDGVYLLLLGIGVGCIITSAFAAATIFSAGSYVEHLTIADSGAIMAQIFIKCNYYFNILAIVIIVYELMTFFSANAFANANQRRLWCLVGGVNVILIFLFTLYYTPFILEAQATNNLGTDAFASMHKQSEVVFKILLFTLSAHTIWRGIVGSRAR